MYCMGLVGIGWHQRCTTRNTPITAWARQPGVLFVFFRSPWVAVELDLLCGVENLTSEQREWSSRSVYGKAHTRQPQSIAIAVSGSGHARSKNNHNSTLPSVCKKVRLKNGS